jgi:hypothetical protein
LGRFFDSSRKDQLERLINVEHQARRVPYFPSVHFYAVRHTETLGQFGQALVERP